MHRQTVGVGVYAAELLLHPIVLALAALLAAPTPRHAGLLAITYLARAAFDGAAAAILRPTPLSAPALLLGPARELLTVAAWAGGLLSDRITWRGNTLRVLPGTRQAAVTSARREANLGSRAGSRRGQASEAA
jgi:hypothetical protein